VVHTMCVVGLCICKKLRRRGWVKKPKLSCCDLVQAAIEFQEVKRVLLVTVPLLC